jgi:predicted 2-oxoglutarate/Fe(II)-dependent dioxygenase YbiX
MSLRLAAGDLVIFPSWLLHHVQPFEGEGHRITVAFNARFRFQEA